MRSYLVGGQFAAKVPPQNSYKQVLSVESELTKNGFIVVSFQSDALLSRLDEEMPHKFIVEINFSCKRKKRRA